jgi:hypothetical protein
MRKGLDEIRRVIGEQEPQKPSDVYQHAGLGRSHSRRAAEAGRQR